MKKRLKDFLFRGMISAGFGPIVYGVVMLCIDLSGTDLGLNGIILFKGIISTYLLAFVIAGASIIWKEERLGLSVQIAIHGLVLYISYLVTYLFNGWLSSNWISLLVFTLIFFVSYAIIWLVIYLVEKNRANKFNKQLR